MDFRITLLQWDKAKKTLTQDEENGNFDSPTEHALNILGFPSVWMQWMFKLAESIDLPIIDVLLMHKSQLGEDKPFPPNEQEQMRWRLRDVFVKIYASVHCH